MDATAATAVATLLGAATGGRAHARIGNRYIDMKEMAEEGKGA